MINTQEQYDNDDKQYAKFIRFLKENNVLNLFKILTEKMRKIR